MLKTIELHGALAEKFGKYFKLQVDTAREAAHAIAEQLPEFKRFMLTAEQAGMRFAIFLDEQTKERNISEDDLDNITDAQTIHIVPRLMGSGGKAFGWLQVVAGAALVGFGAFTFGATSSIGIGMIGAGVGLMLGGATSLLMPTPKLDVQDEDGNRANYGFGGAVTTTAQGNAVPILYGERMVGGFLISAGIYTEDTQ
ncbi:tail assembly protein [uncultured Psychrobacter sp.]|uniref:tail assembly protein n=1 Tax=uncultured Psychrobacter sp. TaxID=259303 RepID=UPI00259204DE|nr:tail assembly protein [uncultured Psychrobacter sp.]